MNKPLIAPSVLACDFANLQSEIEMLNESEADWIHIDIMDGVFVPNLSFGIPVVQAIKRHAKKPMDVHLMIQNPENYVEAFKEAGAKSISVHYEACNHLHRNLQQIKSLGCKAGVAINPHVNVQVLKDIITDIDVVCLMSVNPGFGGQKFIPNTYRKIEQLKEIITDSGTSTLIEVDGGVTKSNAKRLLKAGADVLVAGSFVFSSSSPKDTISSLKHVV
ncbi:ribulose-phosphate 3-epimerase [Fulvivirga sp. M361]|uniref:ribulose-phosphate 3-epimerase n=1 Tax=Fulvivirga sp. M361 TaxID=2594266 RepID=UPI00117994F3|nr:ribulose-phosphate 3-epimerase [Fulvivirga sp. M361]TRX51390.1 ribulose-phosphate 3-epimerase [Fulvivirga sp. M361]